MVAKDLARKKFPAGGAGQPWWPGNPPGSRRNPPRENPGKAPGLLQRYIARFIDASGFKMTVATVMPDR